MKTISIASAVAIIATFATGCAVNGAPSGGLTAEDSVIFEGAGQWAHNTTAITVSGSVDTAASPATTIVPAAGGDGPVSGGTETQIAPTDVPVPAHDCVGTVVDDGETCDGCDSLCGEGSFCNDGAVCEHFSPATNY